MVFLHDQENVLQGVTRRSIRYEQVRNSHVQWSIAAVNSCILLLIFLLNK
jgi:hypothetical protein